MHGGWDDHRTWNRVIPGLANALQVLAVDRRSHGESEGPLRGSPVRDDAGDLIALLEGTGFFPTHLVGHAYGGAVALRLAVDRPDLVRSVVVYEAPFYGLVGERPNGRTVEAEGRDRIGRLRTLVAAGRSEDAAKGYLDAFGAPEDRWDRLEPEDRQAMLRNASLWATELADPEATAPDPTALGGVAEPVLTLVGGRSPPVARAVHAALTSVLPNVTAIELPDAGHWLQRTDPDRLVGVLGTFLLERNVPTT